MYDLLFWTFDQVEKLGLPLAVAAWVTVFGGAIAMGLFLRRRPVSRGQWLAAIVVGAVALAAHLADYFVTLRISPDLALEANPIWRIVVDNLGLAIARWYGLTGKILVSILSAQLFAYYLSERARLFPARAYGVLDFIRGFGGTAPRRFGISTAALAFFAFLFAMLGPYFFYIAFMNSIGDSNEELYASLPSPPVTIVVYLMFLLAAFFAESWRAFRAGERRETRTASR